MWLVEALGAGAAWGDLALALQEVWAFGTRSWSCLGAGGVSICRDENFRRGGGERQAADAALWRTYWACEYLEEGGGSREGGFALDGSLAVLFAALK